jgi:dihydrofolate synthase/folylpolyglutamate synthase
MDHLNILAPQVQTVADSEYGPASYFEVLTALAFLVFRHHQVDYAVVEVGMGGTMDATNTINRPDKLAVITQIGYDHTKFLGETLPQIAKEKAGIIRSGIKTLALDQAPEIMEVFRAKATHERADLEVFVPGKHVQHIHLSESGSSFNLKLKPWIWRDLHTRVIGRHQAINTGLAIRAVQILTERDGFNLSEDVTRSTLQNLTIPGRFDIKHLAGKEIILDGAHNQQKLSGLRDSLKALYPKQKFTLLLSFKSDKELLSALEIIAPIAAHVVVTNLEGVGQDVPPEFMDPAYVAQELNRLGVANTAVVTSNSTALDKVLGLPSDVIVCTGSFYLLDELYNELEKRGNK